MSEVGTPRPEAVISVSAVQDRQRSIEHLEAQKNLFAAQERASNAQERVNRSALESMLANPQLQLAQLQVAQAEKIMPAQLELQQKNLEFMAKQQENLQTTFDILFSQTRWAARMFYATFALGFALVLVSVMSYLFRRDPNDLLTIAFLGSGALAMLYFFLRDPAKQVQQTAGKLVQILAAMRCHVAEVSGWEHYFASRISTNEPLSHQELEMALRSIRDGTQTIMKQLDESLDERGA